MCNAIGRQKSELYVVLDVVRIETSSVESMIEGWNTWINPDVRAN